MLKPHHFYREFEKLEEADKFSIIDTPKVATSLFVIFKKLGIIRAQKRYFEKQEAHLLSLAEIGLNQLNKTNGKIQRD